MENASKALIIAGVILISVALISIFMYIFTAIGEYRSNSQAQLQSNEIIAANRFFVESAYDLDSSKPGVQIYGHDVYNLIRKANDVNDNPDSEFWITTNLTEATFNNQSNLKKMYTYSYTMDSLGYVNALKFE